MPGPLPILLKTILLGTERSPLTDAERAAMGQEPGDADAAQVALEALSTLHLRRKAGFILADAPADLPTPAPLDERPLCTTAAVRLLRLMLGGQQHLALAEFLGLISAAGQRLPPELLPDILQKGLDNRALLQQLEPLLGPTGHWLAAQHLRWRSLLPDPQADWFTAALEDRLRLLRNMRRRSPLAALAWLEATWTQESSLHQVEFLDILVIGLSEFDEPLLQRAAADKKDKVRVTAWRLLELLRLSPPEKLQLATAPNPDYFPPAVTRDHWPKTARLALLSANVFPAVLLADVWPRLLAQLTIPNRTTPDFFTVEEVARTLAYQADLATLETGLRHYTPQMPGESAQMLVNILTFRRQMVAAFGGTSENG